ncbi:ABC transporter ATP-binding protein [Brachybacterium sp. YJGR34]|uniref:ABC transporter ATP-binding protein n=1 Tax=Brachybacterium sp. YJGR34 TaxID=2059911 RepID=UPI000E0C536F|nr:ABC transporter ATP-binding protein [Brachybacterium sp. YJGR34]
MTETVQQAPVVDLDGVSQRFVTDSGDVVHALAETSIQIPQGQFVCVVGPSGCGKTTLLKIIAGFLDPTGGAARYRGEQITGPGAARGVVFQQPNLYPWYSVRDNVALGMRMRKVGKAERARKAQEHLELVGLGEFGDAKPYELSGGMQQRAQIARVLANETDVILMDEPFGALDAITRARLQADLLALQRAQHRTVFFITHDVDEAVFLGDRVLVMSARPGRVVLDQEVTLSQQAGHQLGEEMRRTAEFIELRERIAGAIEH